MTNVLLMKARLAMGMSQKNLAKVLGFRTGQFVSNWERGLAPVPIPVLKQLKVVLRIPKKQLISSMLVDYHEKLEKSL